MAKVWRAFEGREPTGAFPWIELPLAEAIRLFELKQNGFIADLQSPPRFEPGNRLGPYAGFKHIVVEIEEGEGRDNWTPGFYKSRIKPKEGFRRLLEQPIISALGTENVQRVEYQSAIDSQGQGALRVTVVITPGAIRRLPRGATIDASARLRERLAEMRDERTPIIEYATEAELLQDADR